MMGLIKILEMLMISKKSVLTGILTVGILGLLTGCGSDVSNVKGSATGIKKIKSRKPVVMVSTFSLYEAAHAVAGNTLDIQSIVPLGSDPHMFSPNPTQVAQMTGAAVFIYNGAGFETWAESLKNTLPKTTQTMDMSQHVDLIKGGEDHHDGHHHGAYDPHYWLSIDNMIKMTQTLEATFSRIEPANSALYHKNVVAYIAQLQKLKSEYSMGLKECRIRALVSNHDAFGYLTNTNNLQNISIIGLSSDEQPSAKTIARTIEEVKKYQLKTIFFESFINDSISQTIAQETSTKAVALQPLENISEDELKSHQTYLSIMRSNLAKLREAMECQ